MSETSPPKGLRLRVHLPTEVLVDENVRQVVAEAENGSFCLLPRHIDFVAALVPGLLAFELADGGEGLVAVDRGLLVKIHRDVFVSTPNGVRGTDLRELSRLVEERFIEIDEHERRTRSALARLEAGALRGFHALQEELRG